jgi:hypothetical protein
MPAAADRRSTTARLGWGCGSPTGYRPTRRPSSHPGRSESALSNELRPSHCAALPYGLSLDSIDAVLPRSRSSQFGWAWRRSILSFQQPCGCVAIGRSLGRRRGERAERRTQSRAHTVAPRTETSLPQVTLPAPRFASRTNRGHVSTRRCPEPASLVAPQPPDPAATHQVPSPCRLSS